jgi:hypothetical protein
VEIAPHSLATVDVYAHNGDLLIPAYAGPGRLPGHCSGEWKRDVIYRHLRARGVKECVMWLGISFEERHRCKPAHRSWVRHEFPLVDHFITREGCLLLAEKAGLPRPPKSACWMCPHRDDAGWRWLREKHPDDWQRAVEFDDGLRAAARETAPRADGRVPLEHPPYLHSSRVSLRMADIDRAGGGQLELFSRDCSSGYCWT